MSEVIWDVVVIGVGKYNWAMERNNNPSWTRERVMAHLKLL